MPLGTDTSWEVALSPENVAKRDLTRHFKTVRTGRLVLAIFGVVFIVMGGLMGYMLIFSHIGLGAFMAAALVSLGVAIAVLFFFIIPKWCSLAETVTFRDDGFHSALYGDVLCKDITSYALSTFGGSDRSVKVVTAEKKIQYNFGNMGGADHKWMVKHMLRVIDDYNARVVLAQEKSVGGGGQNHEAVADGSQTSPPIRENGFFKSPAAGLLVAVGVVISIVLLMLPGVGAARFGQAAMIFGASMSILGGMIKTRNSGR